MVCHLTVWAGPVQETVIINLVLRHVGCGTPASGRRRALQHRPGPPPPSPDPEPLHPPRTRTPIKQTLLPGPGRQFKNILLRARAKKANRHAGCSYARLSGKAASVPFVAMLAHAK